MIFLISRGLESQRRDYLSNGIMGLLAIFLKYVSRSGYIGSWNLYHINGKFDNGGFYRDYTVRFFNLSHKLIGLIPIFHVRTPVKNECSLEGGVKFGWKRFSLVRI